MSEFIFERKLRSDGKKSSLMVTLPPDLVKFYNVEKGDTIRFKIDFRNEINVDFEKPKEKTEGEK